MHVSCFHRVVASFDSPESEWCVFSSLRRLAEAQASPLGWSPLIVALGDQCERSAVCPTGSNCWSCLFLENFNRTVLRCPEFLTQFLMS